MVQANPKDELDAAPRVWIRVHKTGDRNEQKQVYVGVNGVGYLIRRGVNVEVPEPVVRVLEQAVQTVFDVEADESGLVNALVRREALAYPFTRLG